MTGKRVINAMPIISELEIEIDDTAGISPLELKAKCRRQKDGKRLGLGGYRLSSTYANE